MMKLKVTALGMIGSLILSTSWSAETAKSVSAPASAPQAQTQAKPPVTPNQQQNAQKPYQTSVNAYLKTIDTERTVILECARLANVIHTLPAPKDYEKHQQAQHVIAAAKFHGLFGKDVYLCPPGKVHNGLACVEPLNPQFIAYEAKLNQDVQALNSCGQRYKQGLPYEKTSRDWLFKNVDEKDTANQTSVGKVFEDLKVAHDKLTAEVDGLSKDPVHKTAVSKVLQEYFFDFEKRDLPPPQK